MNFEEFLKNNLNESVNINNAQMNVLRKSIDTTDLTNKLKTEFNKLKDKYKIIDTYYIKDISANKDDQVIMNGSVIIEVDSNDNIYFKAMNFSYNIDTKELLSTSDSDVENDENWKNVQNSILMVSKRL